MKHFSVSLWSIFRLEDCASQKFQYFLFHILTSWYFFCKFQFCVDFFFPSIPFFHSIFPVLFSQIFGLFPTGGDRKSSKGWLATVAVAPQVAKSSTCGRRKSLRTLFERTQQVDFLSWFDNKGHCLSVATGESNIRFFCVIVGLSRIGESEWDINFWSLSLCSTTVFLFRFFDFFPTRPQVQ